MKLNSKLFGIMVIAINILASYSKDSVSEVSNDNIYAIRSVLEYGKTHEKKL